MPVLTRELSIRIGIVSMMLVAGAFGLFDWVLRQGQTIEVARTVAVNMFVFGELFYLFNCRSLRYSMFKLGVFSNQWLILGVISMIMLQLLFTYTPAMNTLFGTAPIGFIEWMLVLSGGFLIYAVVGLDKWFGNRARRKLADG